MGPAPRREAAARNQARVQAGAQTLTLDGTATICRRFAGLNEAEAPTLYVPEMLLPNLFLNIQPDYVNSHLMFPTGPESVRIVYDWLFEPRHLALSAGGPRRTTSRYGTSPTRRTRATASGSSTAPARALPARPLRAAGVRLPPLRAVGAPRAARAAGEAAGRARLTRAPSEGLPYFFAAGAFGAGLGAGSTDRASASV